MVHTSRKKSVRIRQAQPLPKENMMNPDFQAAAVSYFGLPDGTVLIPSDPGYLAFHVVFDAPTLAGIAARMQEMAKSRPGIEIFPEFVPDLPLEVLRVRYNLLSAKDKAQYGSFARYCSTWQRDEVGSNGREVKHVDAPVEADGGLPEAVWVPAHDVLAHQVALASDEKRIKGMPHSLLQVAVLDEVQRAKYVPGGAV